MNQLCAKTIAAAAMISFGGLLILPAAAFSGADDFNDGTLDVSSWSPLIEANAVLDENSGFLRLTPSGTNEYGGSSHYRWNHDAPVQTNWLFQVDLRMPYARSPSNAVYMGAYVTPAPPVVVVEEEYSYVGGRSIGVVYGGGGGYDEGWNEREFGSDYFNTDQIASDGRTRTDTEYSSFPVFSTLISVRFRWDTNQKIFTTEYDLNGPVDGYNWTVSASRHLEDYEWDLTKDFAIILWGRFNESGAGDLGVRATVSNKTYGFDNFRAQTLPSSPIAPVVNSVTSEQMNKEVEISSEPNASYTLESKASLGMPTWTPVETVVSDGATTILRDPLSVDKQEFYRVRSP